jgi:hypothetical protein
MAYCGKSISEGCYIGAKGYQFSNQSQHRILEASISQASQNVFLNTYNILLCGFANMKRLLLFQTSTHRRLSGGGKTRLHDSATTTGYISRCDWFFLGQNSVSTKFELVLVVTALEAIVKVKDLSSAAERSISARSTEHSNHWLIPPCLLEYPLFFQRKLCQECQSSAGRTQFFPWYPIRPTGTTTAAVEHPITSNKFLSLCHFSSSDIYIVRSIT